MSIEDITMVQNEAQGIFTLIQQLQLPATENNVAILNACMGSLKLIGKTMEAAKEGQQDEADTE